MPRDITDKKMHLKMMVAHHGPNGPAFFFCKVTCTRRQYDDGDHYETARRECADRKHGGEYPMIAFDENNNAPKSFFKNIDFELAPSFLCTE